MEVKYTGILPEVICQTLKQADDLPTSNSKYAIARMQYL